MPGGVRAAVLCSMFFVLFEGLNGDRDAAEAQLLCGQRMVDELHQLVPNGMALANTTTLRKELRNLIQYISLQVSIGGVISWKGEFDTLCQEYLSDFAAEQYNDVPLGCEYDVAGTSESVASPAEDNARNLSFFDFLF